MEHTMRKFVICLMALLFLFSLALPSWSRAENTGELSKNVYTDAKFGFQITGLDNWKMKTDKEPSLLRLVMTQKNYKVSNIPGSTQYTTSIPTIIVLADTTSLTLKQVEQSLFEGKGFLSNKDAFLMKLDLIPNSEYLEIHDVTVDSVPARDYTLKQPYKKTGEDIRVHDSMYGNSVIINDFLAGHVVMFKKDRNIYMIQFSCEREFFYPNDVEFQKMLASWKFSTPP
jgi:hypothetical protein